MKNRLSRLVGISFSIFCLAAVSAKAFDPSMLPKKPSLGKIRVEWDDAKLLAPGGYARVHRLNDGRYMAVYSRGGDGCFKISNDGWSGWTPQRAAMLHGSYVAPAKVVVSNAEFAQLSEQPSPSEPHHLRREHPSCGEQEYSHALHDCNIHIRRCRQDMERNPRRL